MENEKQYTDEEIMEFGPEDTARAPLSAWVRWSQLYGELLTSLYPAYIKACRGEREPD